MIHLVWTKKKLMKKRLYIAPIIDFVELDKMVTLVMTSPNTPPNPEDPYGAPSVQESEATTTKETIPTKQSSFDENPFNK